MITTLAKSLLTSTLGFHSFIAFTLNHTLISKVTHFTFPISFFYTFLSDYTSLPHPTDAARVVTVVDGWADKRSSTCLHAVTPMKN